MKIITNYYNPPPQAKEAVVALGNFDGVHKGHAAVINKTLEIARERRKASAVLTFEPHPVMVLRDGVTPFRLTTPAQKADIIHKHGVDYLFQVRFDVDFSEMTAEDFFTHILLQSLEVSHIITGENFIFGHNREGDADFLAKMAKIYGIGYTRLSGVGNEEIYSSSLIRKYIKEGRLEQARTVLGRNFSICGKIEHGDKKGRQLGFPTANIDMGDYIRPAYGVYAVAVYIEGKDWPFYGAANIGVRPTLSGEKEWLEVHIFDFNEEIYGLEVEIELIEYIRPEKKFAGLEELRSQIAMDCKNIKQVIGI